MSYIKGTIYQIICKLNPDIRYIGSTFNTLRNRWQVHKYDYENWKQGKRDAVSIYKYFNEIGIENFKMMEIKSYQIFSENSKDHKHLSAYEQLWINKIKCINEHNAFNIPFVDKNTNKLRCKQYWENNREKLLQSNRDYYQSNQAQILEQKKAYYIKNKEKIQSRGQEKIECPCGGHYKVRDKYNHFKRKMHIKFLQISQEEKKNIE
jgi:hypothetical protein